MTVSIQEINDPSDLRKLKIDELPVIAQDIRDIIIETVSKRGGHLGPPLGVVELTLALHYVFDTPKDKLMWDVGHQAYAHKILTGRRDQFSTLKQYGGISGYPNIDESEYDLFTVGHSSTSISQALGMATVRDLNGTDEKSIAVIGDGALTAGMAFEAINNAGQLKKNLLVILNDNEMSIAKNVGAISDYLNRIITAPIYNKVRGEVRGLLKKLPDSIGDKAIHAVGKLEESLKGLLVPGLLFEELGFYYVGPIDGHNLPALIQTFQNLETMDGPILVHVLTKKGKGYHPAESKPDVYHGTAAFDIETGETQKGTATSYTKVFSNTMMDVAKKNDDMIALTAAMPSGVGLNGFAEAYPERFYDVGIAEQHCVTFAGSLAAGGKRPVAALYATFLQRAIDQVIHDVCLQNAPVLFCLDRMGIVGEDGASHNGVFTISLLRCLPNMVLMLPKDGADMEAMIHLGIGLDTPASVCYPKGNVCDHLFESIDEQPVELGRAQILKQGAGVAICAFGSMVAEAWKAAELLAEDGIDVTVVNMRFVKPIDHDMIKRMAETHDHLLIVEEGALMGGAGAAVMESLAEQSIHQVNVKCLGLPDHFIEHGARGLVLEKMGLDSVSIARDAKAMLGVGDTVGVS